LENLQQRLLAKARKSAENPKQRKSLVELFAPLRGLDLDFERNPSYFRPIDL